MCINMKISTFLLILAPMVMSQEEEIPPEIFFDGCMSDFGAYDQVEKKGHVINNPEFFGRHSTLVCSWSRDEMRYSWTKNNESLKESEDVQLLDNGKMLDILKVTPKTAGNYTCKCEVAACKSHTRSFHVYNVKNRDEDAKSVEQFLERLFKPDIEEIFEKIFTGKEIEKEYHYERQNFSTDFQKISVENADPKKSLVLSCLDENDPYGNNYDWLENNISLKNNSVEISDKEPSVPGALLMVPLSEESSRNYTCICNNTSCMPHMHTYQVIISEPKKEVDIAVSHEVKKDAIVEKVPVLIGRNATLSCPDLNGTAQYVWLKENDCNENCTSTHLEFLDNKHKLRVRATSKTIGNYTCECKIADCKSYTFQLYFDKNKDEDAQTIQNIIEEVFKPMNGMQEFLNLFGYKSDKFYHYGRQNYSTDVQKIFVENVGPLRKMIVLTCFDENNVYGDKYTWLKNNVSFENESTKIKDYDVRGALLVLEREQARSGNYTCICKDTSCVPYMHTYQVTATEPDNKGPLAFNQSNLVSTSTETEIESTTPWPDDVININ